MSTANAIIIGTSVPRRGPSRERRPQAEASQFRARLPVSAMTTYTVLFRSHTGWAYYDIEAETPAKALALARKLKTEDKLNLCFEAYNVTTDVNSIVVSNADGRNLAFWYDEDMTLGMAAWDLLDAAELVVARWERGDPAEAVRELSAAIAKAKGGAA